MGTSELRDKQTAPSSVQFRRMSFPGSTILKLTLLVIAMNFLWAGPALAAEDGTETDAAVATETVVQADLTAPDAASEGAVEQLTAHVEQAVLGVTEAETFETGAAGSTAVATDQADAAKAIQPGAVSAGENAAAANSEEPCDCGAEGGLATACDCQEIKELLELICLKGDDNVFWASIEDYNAGLLSLRYSLSNTSTDTSVNNIRVSSATATNGVKVHDLLPLALGSLQPGESMEFLLKWEVPKGVGQFVTDISLEADCEELCADCKPECEGDECEPLCEGAGCKPPVDEEKQPPALEPATFAPLLQGSALPNTGLDVTITLTIGLGLLLLGGLLPAAKAVRQRIR